MPCIVPTCDSKTSSTGRMRKFPANPELTDRWLHAIRVGCQLENSKDPVCDDGAEICDDHFDATDRRFRNPHYLEPTVFRDRTGNIATVRNCKMCLQFYRCSDVLEYNGSMEQEICLSSYVCVECLARQKIADSVMGFFDQTEKEVATLFRNINQAVEQELLDKLLESNTEIKQEIDEHAEVKNTIVELVTEVKKEIS